MAVERQVVADETDLMLKEDPQTTTEEAGQWSRRAAPEEAMVYE